MDSRLTDSLVTNQRQILHVSTGLELGGAEMLLIECADVGRRHGFVPTVVSLRAGGPNRVHLLDRHIAVIEVGMSPHLPDPRAILFLARLIRTLRPALIQSWLYHANLVTLAATVLAGRRPSESLVWGIFQTAFDFSQYSRRMKTVFDLGARLSQRPAAIFYNAERAESEHVAHGFRARQSIVTTNFVDTDRFRPDPEARARLRAGLGIAPETPVAIVAARNDPQKDWPTVLAAVNRVPGLVTLAVGTGTDRLPDQPGVLRLGPRMDMPPLYVAADLFLLPSGFGEGTSVAMCEAMASGLPVIVTDVGDNGRFGRAFGAMVPTGAPDAVAAAISALVDEPARRIRLGAAARQAAVESFARDTALQPLMAAYAGIARNADAIA